MKSGFFTQQGATIYDFLIFMTIGGMNNNYCNYYNKNVVPHFTVFHVSVHQCPNLDLHNYLQSILCFLYAPTSIYRSYSQILHATHGIWFQNQNYYMYNLYFAFQMTILLRMDDKMNRQLTCHVSEIDNSFVLAQELVYFGFINEVIILNIL